MLVYNEDLNICIGVGSNTIIRVEESTLVFDYRLIINGVIIYHDKDKKEVEYLMKSIINGYERGLEVFYV